MKGNRNRIDGKTKTGMILAHPGDWLFRESMLPKVRLQFILNRTKANAATFITVLISHKGRAASNIYGGFA